MELKQLRAAAKELNAEMGLEPAINVKGSEEEIIAGIKEALPEITPEDEWTDETQEILDEIAAMDEKKGKGKTKAKVEEEDEDEDEDEEPAPKKKSPAKKAKVEEEDEDEEDEDEEPAPPAKKVVKIPAKKAKVEEEDEDEEPAPKKKGTPGKAVPKKEGSLAEMLDKLVLAGGTFESISAKINKEAEKRGAKIRYPKGSLMSHIKYRLSKDPKWLGKLKITETGIE